MTYKRMDVFNRGVGGFIITKQIRGRNREVATVTEMWPGVFITEFNAVGNSFECMHLQQRGQTIKRRDWMRQNWHGIAGERVSMIPRSDIDKLGPRKFISAVISDQILISDIVTMRRDPANPFDINAIGVYVDDKYDIGYLPKELSEFVVKEVLPGRFFIIGYEPIGKNTNLRLRATFITEKTMVSAPVVAMKKEIKKEPLGFMSLSKMRRKLAKGV